MQPSNEKSPAQCAREATQLDTITLHGILSRLTIERIEDKAERIATLHESCDKMWDNTLFKLLARSFGFGIQGAQFEEWASLLSMQAAGKHRDNIEQVEAIFFGQAGLLEEESIPQYYRAEALASEKYRTLAREYKFLKSKFQLQQMDYRSWDGRGTPHLRIARLASLYYKQRTSIATIADCNTTTELREKLQIQPEWYWQHHTQFGSTTTVGAGDISRQQLDVLIINTIVPILYSYGKHRHDTTLCNKAEDYLHLIDSESNSITRRWTQEGVLLTCAADSQAIIQLNNNYCNKHRCEACPIARHLQ